MQSLPPTNYAPEVAPWRQRFDHFIVTRFNPAADWLLEHWLGIINWSLGLILLGALLVPVLAWLGFEPLAAMLFHSYHSICEQVPSHSLFILGHQMAMCPRNFSLYGAIWLGSMIFRFTNKRIPPLDWRLAILMLLPMAIDGLTQLAGLRESNLVLRIITGSLFGFGGCWFALPYVQQAVDESAPAPTFAAPETR